MSDLTLLWIIQSAPLAAFLLILLLPGGLKKIAPLVAILAAGVAAGSAASLFISHADAASLPGQWSVTWLTVGDKALEVGFLLDRLNLLMITIVTVIAFFVQLFSYYYMAEDASRARYFGFLSFFAFSMTGLVLSNNLLQTFLFWELVGLTSYLLIGFWFEKPSAATAARKAFVINRLADLGFYLGIILLLITFGTLNFTALQPDALKNALGSDLLTLLGILIFMGVMGKSAQFPFHNWLPDAMEGPTPVSALIHSATMVAAGVFLLARNFGLFGSSEVTLQVILVIGTLTALTGAVLATNQRDIKKILAYSTISQLGLMVMAIGAGSTVAGIFHLSTHACFKSLLFLTAGAFIHRFHSNDILEIAKHGGKKELLSMFALTLGLLSLSGVFPFSGFFSKDMILESLKEHSLVFYGIGLFVSFLTAYYSCRLFFVLMLTKIEGHAHAAHADSALASAAKALPLMALAVLSLVVGALGTPVAHSALLHWLGGHDAHFDSAIILTSSALIIIAAVIAFIRFRNPEAALLRWESNRGPLKTVLDHKLFIDDIYVFFVKQVGLRIAHWLNRFDRWFVNDVMVNGTSFRILDLGKIAVRLQNGQLQDYLCIALVVGIAALFMLT